MKRVLVTNGMARTCLVATRSLGRQSLQVTVADEERLSLAGFSRYSANKVRYPSPERSPEAWYRWLQEHLERERYDCVIPVDQESFRVLSQHNAEFSQWSRIPVVDYATFRVAYDKALTFKRAQELGIPIPRTYFVTSEAELSRLAPSLALPLVIKPRIGSGSRAVAYVRDRDQLVSAWARIHRLQPYPLIQEYIPGGGEALGVGVLMNANAEPRAVFVHKRLREYPRSGGPSTLRESVIRPEAALLATRLLQGLGWYGVAMVEFKVDPRDGVPKLMEINPKLWGSIALAVAAGVDFPHLLYRLATEGDVPPVRNYRAGVRCRFLPADVLHFITNPDRWRLEPSFFRFGDAYGDIWDREDPLPGLALPLLLLTRGLRPSVLRHVFNRSRPDPGSVRESQLTNPLDAMGKVEARDDGIS